MKFNSLILSILLLSGVAQAQTMTRINNYKRDSGVVTFEVGANKFAYQEVGMPELQLVPFNKSPLVMSYLSHLERKERESVESWLFTFRRLWFSDLAVGTPDEQGDIPFILTVAWQPKIFWSTQATLRAIGKIKVNSNAVNGKNWDDSDVVNRKDSWAIQHAFERFYRLSFSGIAWSDEGSVQLPIENVQSFLAYVLNPLLTMHLNRSVTQDVLLK